MEYRVIPGTDLRVSRICFGTWNFGDRDTWGKKFPQDEGNKVIDVAIENGINFFDCAEAYGKGKAEKILGRAISGRHDRSKLIIATKFGLHKGEDAAIYNAKDIENALEESLKRLQTTYIDLYYIHWASNVGSYEETVSTLEKLRASGKIRYYGVCNFSHIQLEKLKAAGGRTQVNQVPYNLIWRAIEFDLIPYCQQHNIGILAYSPLQQGLLSGKYKTPDEVPAGIARSRHFHKNRSPKCRHDEEGAEKETFEAISKLRDLSTKHNISMAHLAHAWLLKQPAVTSIIVGASSAQQLKQNCHFEEVPDQVLDECTQITDELKLKLGRNPDMWARTSRYEY